MHDSSRCTAARSGVSARPDPSAAVRRARRHGGVHHRTPHPTAADTEALRRYAVMLARKLSRGQFDPEDLAHEALERWLRCAPRMAPVVDPRAWVTVVLRRLLVDRLRRRRAAAPGPAAGVAPAPGGAATAPRGGGIQRGRPRRALRRPPPPPR